MFIFSTVQERNINRMESKRIRQGIKASQYTFSHFNLSFGLRMFLPVFRWEIFVDFSFFIYLFFIFFCLFAMVKQNVDCCQLFHGILILFLRVCVCAFLFLCCALVAKKYALKIFCTSNQITHGEVWQGRGLLETRERICQKTANNNCIFMLQTA